MKLISKGCLTDLLFIEFDGEVRDCGDYLLARTPSNPKFFWGNYIAVEQCPTEENWPRWLEVFDREISQKNPGTHHIAIGWDRPTEKNDFIRSREAEGFIFDESVVLESQCVVASTKFNPLIEVRPLMTESEWDEAREIQIACRADNFSYEEYEIFKRPQMIKYQQMVAAGMGHWFGAFIGSRMAGNLGIFRSGTLGRFQTVGTHPDFRRSGVCSTLVYKVSRYAFERMGLENLVMVADENYHAAKIYESVGFRPIQKHYGLYRWS